MMRPCVSTFAPGAIALAGAALLWTPPATSADEKSAPAPRFEDKYAILVEKNIFSRTRRSAARRREETRTEAPPPEPESSFVFTGTVLKDGERFAFVEDSSSRKTMKLRVGDPVARGKVTKVDFDAFEYDRGGTKTLVGIGKTLSGGAAPSRSRSEPRGPSGSSPGSRETGSRGAGPGDSGSRDSAGPAAKSEAAEAKEGASPAPSGSSSGASGTDAILERLRRQRQEEDKK